MFRIGFRFFHLLFYNTEEKSGVFQRADLYSDQPCYIGRQYENVKDTFLIC